jgi:hypothetical protein
MNQATFIISSTPKELSWSYRFDGCNELPRCLAVQTLKFYIVQANSFRLRVETVLPLGFLFGKDKIRGGVTG